MPSSQLLVQDQTKPNAASRWPTIQDANLRRLVIISIGLSFTCFLAIVFKAVSVVAWQSRPDSLPISIPGETSPWLALSLENVDFFANHGDALTWSAFTASFVLSIATLYSVLRVTCKGPYYWTRLQHSLYYAVYLACCGFGFGVFICLTCFHATSTRFTTSSLDNGVSCEGLCGGDLKHFEGGRFDLETWACDSSAYSGLQDDDHILRRVCVGETAARGLLLATAVLVAANMVILEMDRRGSKSFMNSWKVRSREEQGEVYEGWE